MRIYQSPEIKIEELSTEDIVLGSGPSVGGNGTIITPRGGIISEGATDGATSSDIGGFDYGAGFSADDIAGNL